MSRLILDIVDVFAEEKCAGNPLAVVRYGRAVSDTMMRKLAREMNFSETTFIDSDQERNGGYDVRIFTPKEEVPFAGHPTLGTAYVIRNEIVKNSVDRVLLNLKVGQIPVSFSSDRILWMKQNTPTFGKRFESGEISTALSIEKQAIDDRFPIEEVSTGLPFIIVPLRKLNDVKQCRVARDKYFALIEKTASKAILAFSPETYDARNNLNVRVFVDYYGIPEDPATGSANGCLAGYLSKYRYFGVDRVNVRVEQGYEMGRPSLLYLTAEIINGRMAVSVGGKVVPVAKGELL